LINKALVERKVYNELVVIQIRNFSLWRILIPERKISEDHLTGNSIAIR